MVIVKYLELLRTAEQKLHDVVDRPKGNSAPLLEATHYEAASLIQELNKTYPRDCLEEFERNIWHKRELCERSIKIKLLMHKIYAELYNMAMLIGNEKLMVLFRTVRDGFRQ